MHYKSSLRAFINGVVSLGEGMASVFNFGFCSRPPFSYKKRFGTDTELLASDWQNVGNDLSDALKNLNTTRGSPNRQKAFILGGTKGLGLELALEANRRGITPIIAGRSAQDLDLKIPKFTLDLCNLNNLDQLEEWVLHEQPNYFFWVAGIFLKKPFGSSTKKEIEKMIQTHLAGPIEVLQRFHQSIGLPYHLVTIASTSSWRIRKNETLYCSLKAAKAAFTRNFAQEMSSNYPGSKTTLINPGGLKTPNFWQNTDQNIDNFMDPARVARIIWDQVEFQKPDFEELQIMRTDDGTPQITTGPRTPEKP